MYSDAMSQKPLIKKEKIIRSVFVASLYDILKKKIAHLINKVI